VSKKVLAYIVYGDDKSYYESVCFSILTAMSFLCKKDNVDIVVLTENTEFFEKLPIKIFKISSKQIEDWSFEGEYHFRIKNRGLGFLVNKLSLSKDDKVLYIDADSYFKKTPLKLFDLIKKETPVMFRCEGSIFKKKRFRVYKDNLQNVPIKISEEKNYLINDNAKMWGSAIVGLMGEQFKYIDIADILLQEFKQLVPSHTIEQFALSEALSLEYIIIEGKKFIRLYSTSAKADYAKVVLRSFFQKHSKEKFAKQVTLASKLSLRRSVLHMVKQRINKFLTTGESIW
jgi:heptosyltransferase-3